MSHVLNYQGQYFRIDITEVAKPDTTDKTMYVGWCSEAFRDLKDMPKQVCSRFIEGSSLPTHAEALRHAHEWIKIHWDEQKAKMAKQPLKPSTKSSVMYTVWLFKGDISAEFEFEEFADAKLFASAAEKSWAITKAGITNNESPQYLTIWERT